MLYCIAKKSGSLRELDEIKRARAKSSKKHCDSISDSSGDDLDCGSSLSRDSK